MEFNNFLRRLRRILHGDPIKYFKDNFSAVEKETRKKETDEEAFLWLNQYNTWIDILAKTTVDVSKEDSGNSMLILRLLELQKTLIWLQFSALYGSYRPLMRELRFVLESFLQAYYLDTKCPDIKIEEKFKILDEHEMELFGVKLRKKVKLENINEITKFYHLLSKYEHGSAIELKTAIIDGNVDERIFFTYNRELFSECKDLTNKIIDIAFYLVLLRYPNAIPILAKDEMTIYWLKELKSDFTLQLLLNKK